MKYLVQKLPVHNVDLATEKLNDMARDGFEIVYVVNKDNHLFIIFGSSQAQPETPEVKKGPGRPKKIQEG